MKNNSEQEDLSKLMAYEEWSTELLKSLKYWSVGRFVIQGKGSIGPSRLVILMDDFYQALLLARKLNEKRLEL